MTSLEMILNSRDIILLTEVYLVKGLSMVFPVVMYGCESDYKEKLMLLNYGFGEDS